jgi:N-acetylglucosamine-6-phosphate deacetylase
MIVLAGADLILEAGVHPRGTLVIDGDRIVEVSGPSGVTGAVDLRDHIIAPGFIDVHVHGIEGIDSLAGADAIARIATRLPRFGVTAFCPTSVACRPAQLRDMLQSVAATRAGHTAGARVLPAHLESNFINAAYKGAQPADCLRTPPRLRQGFGGAGPSRQGFGGAGPSRQGNDFDGEDILTEIDAAGANVGIVTLAPELDGAFELIAHLVSHGRRVSLGHSGATLDQARAAIAAGARHATHLFNRMPPLNHREPGLVGAILTSEEIAAEVICDGVHVHHDMVRMAVAAKGVSRMIAITDGVAAAGLGEGARATLGGREIAVRDAAAYLDDGTLAGSIATMDRVFRFLVRDVGLSLPDAVRMCATTPASELGLTDTGRIATGAIADLVVLDRDLHVKQTYVGGRLIEFGN